MSKITLVTGLWDIGRGDLQEGWSRSYNHYLEKFRQLLQVNENLIIFGDEELLKFVGENRKSENTQFILRKLDWFKNNEYYQMIQNIRTNPKWYNQVGWLTDSTQAKLEMYNPLVMSKVFLLNDAKILDKFNSEYLFWIDGGITNTVHPGYFTHDKVLDKLPKYIDKFTFITFPYEANTEIHGFEFNKICEYATKQVMGTEESIFSVMIYNSPSIINHIEIESNGLVGKFFEDLKNDNVIVKNEAVNDAVNDVVNDAVNLDLDKVGLYVITFNSPKQFETLIESMLEYDSDFIYKPKKFLLDNSTDLSTTPRYKELCDQYNFTHIKRNNIGIVGGRVFVAEHFDETNLDFQIFFEDDMFFYPKKGEVCRNGFNRYTPNLYQKSLEIVKRENFDYLKLNFTEFYGSNDIQFSWYNTPQSFRESHWPNNPKLPIQGLDPNSPNTTFRNIKIHKGLPYASGEVFLCNWPLILTKKGNYKCYLETRFHYPFEQTLMSNCFQETVKGRINPGVLLLTPTEHNRFDFYSADLRKEC